MKYVPNETYIPSDDDARIRARMMEYIASMSDADLRIAAKSEASLRSFVVDLFRSIAQLFGYMVAQVIGTFRDIGRGIKTGWQRGFEAGLG